MRAWFFEYPAIPTSIVVGLVFAGVVALGIVAAKRTLGPRLHGEGSNRVAEWLLPVFSSFYGILLGLLAVGSYENINSVGDVVANESSAISVLYWNFEGFPQPIRGELQQDLRAYAQELVDHSYPEQVHGQRPTGERTLVRTLFVTVASFAPASAREQELQGEALRQLSALQDARSARLSSIDIGIPTVLWWIVGLGAGITLAMVCLLDFPMTKHLVFGGVLAFFIGAMISVIAAMDNPFSGADRVGAERIQEMLDTVPPR